MEQQLLNLFMYCIPALITGAIAFLFFKEHTENEKRRQLFIMRKAVLNESLPNRLQAYERMVLFLERINPNKLLLRVSPQHEDANAYENLLIATIEQEFEHNLSQQLYLSKACWEVICASKNATIQLIRKTNISKNTLNATKLREAILSDLIDKQAPSYIGIEYIKDDINAFFYKNKKL